MPHLELMRFAYAGGVKKVRIEERLLKHLCAVERAAHEYVMERETLAPDMTMRRITYERLRNLVGVEVELFDPGENEVKLRSDARGTEKIAAWSAFPNSGTQRERVLNYFRIAGRDGATDEEACEDLGLSFNSLRPRRQELVEGGWLVATKERRLTEAGNPAIVWRLSKKARKHFRLRTLEP